MNSLFFYVRPDAAGARLMNLARAAGLSGLLLFLLARFLLARDFELAADIVMIPAGLLGLGNLVWLYLLPALVTGFAYALSAALVGFLNLLHIIVLQRSHPGLNDFLARFFYMRTKTGLAFIGISERIPNVDVFSADRMTEQVELRYNCETWLPVRWLLLRLGALAAFLALGLAVHLGIKHIPYFNYAAAGIPALFLGLLLLSIIINWFYNGFTGRFIQPLLDLQLRVIRLNLTFSGWFHFLINDHNAFRQALTGALAPSAVDTEGWLDSQDGHEHSINLVVLTALIVLTGGIYLLIWLGRTARVMNDDPFTVVTVGVIGLGLPLSVIFSRWYRRLEVKSGNEPSWLLELVLVLPVVNLLMAPFAVQYLLNLFKKKTA